MELWQLVLIIGSVLAATAAFVWMAIKVSHHNHGHTHRGPQQHGKMKGSDLGASAKQTKEAEEEIDRIFDDKFREELRNRGRLHFEKIIGENAMFLQQDLRLTTSELNEYMKQEITRTLREEFAKYEQSITDAKQIATDSIDKTRQAIEQQREILGQQLKEQVEAEKKRLLERFEKNMTEIVNHYVVAAIGNQIDLADQLEYIVGDLEANKQAIMEDIQNGA